MSPDDYVFPSSFRSCGALTKKGKDCQWPAAPDLDVCLAHEGEPVVNESRPKQGPIGAQWYTNQFFKALKAAGITDYVRPFHDMRHTALTNEAATERSNPIALMTKAGHKSFKTTQQYIDLAGVVFPTQAEALEERYSGGV